MNWFKKLRRTSNRSRVALTDPVTCLEQEFRPKALHGAERDPPAEYFFSRETVRKLAIEAARRGLLVRFGDGFRLFDGGGIQPNMEWEWEATEKRRDEHIDHAIERSLAEFLEWERTLPDDCNGISVIIYPPAK